MKAASLFLCLAVSTQVMIADSNNYTRNLEKPKGVAVVFPRDLPKTADGTNRNELEDFYFELISLIPDEFEITIVVKSNKVLKELETILFEKKIIKNVKFIVISSVRDIWIKDWAPIYNPTTKTYRKFLYAPKYLSKAESLPDNKAGIELIEHLVSDNQYEVVDLILDGGNFISNETGVGFITNRVISDNESHSIDEIRNIIESELGIINLNFTPVEYGDETGHIDGILRFISKQTLLINSYAQNETELNSFLESISQSIEKKIGIKPIKLLNGEIDGSKSEGIYSAVGNYVNFLLLGDYIVIPQYNGSNDNSNYKVFEEYFDSEKIIKINCHNLAKKGGVLNCITWVYY